MSNIQLLLYLQWIVANRGRPARDTVAKAIGIILQPEECPELEHSEISEAESDHIWEPI